LLRRIGFILKMAMLQIAVILAWTAAAVLFAVYAASIASEITYVTLADGRKTERKIPLLFRLLLPFVPNLRRFVNRPVFAASRETAEWMIVASGLEGLLSGSEFVALKILVPTVCGSVWAMLMMALGAAVPDSFLSDNKLLLVAFGFLYFYAYPLIWLKSTLKKRHDSIMRALPFVLDLLTLSVEAGMDFMSALQRNCERRKLDPLNEELIRMTSEIQIGISRREALSNMADRVRQTDLKLVAFALVQADKLGVPIAPILRIQSEQLRSRRFDRAEKLANEAPVKMLGPLLLCIFPAVFVVLVAPILMQAAKSIF
jgi:tight adherence protein C